MNPIRPIGLIGPILLAALLASYIVAPPKHAHAGLIIKLPSNLGLSTNLVGHWTMDSGDISWTDGHVYDKSGNNYTGDFVGGMGTTTAPTIGRIGQAMVFDASDDAINAGSSDTLLPEGAAATISLWINPRSFGEGNNGYIISRCNCSNGPAIRMVTPGGVEFFASTDGASDLYRTSATDVIKLNTWQHVLVTWDGTIGSTGIKIYVNGQETSYSAQAGSGNLDDNSAASLYIGNDRAEASHTFDGSIDEARIYSRVLSASEITRLYNMGGTLKVGKTDTTSLTSGLVGHWTMDSGDISWENGTMRDASGNNNIGSFEGAMSTTTAPAIGRIGQGIKFDGSNDRINGGTSDTVWPEGAPATISAWIKPRSLGQSSKGRVVDRSASSRGPNLSMESSNRLSFNADSDGVNYLNKWSATNAITLNAWQHVLATWDGTVNASGVHLYINGQEPSYSIEVGDGNLLDNSSAPTVIGNRWGGGNAFDGEIDDVRIYNRILSASEIRRLYNMGGTLKIGKTDTTSLTSGLVGHWSMDAGDISWTDGNIQDRSGNGNKGAFQGAMGTTTAPTIGKIGQGISFDGSNDYIRAPDAPSLDITAALTISAWVKSNSTANFGNYARILEKAKDNDGCAEPYDMYDLIFDPDHNNLTFSVAVGGISRFVRSVATPSQNVWYHVVGTYDGSNLRIYLNGALDNSTSQSGSIDTSTGDLYFGDSPLSFPSCSSGLFSGSLDDIRIYNRVLTASEITRLYNMGR